MTLTPEASKARAISFIERDQKAADGPGDCQFWRGSCNLSGHGTVMIAGKRIYVHRLAYQIHHGDIPASHHIHHTCGNPRCVNVDHLECKSMREHNKLTGKERRSHHPNKAMSR